MTDRFWISGGGHVEGPRGRTVLRVYVENLTEHDAQEVLQVVTAALNAHRFSRPETKKACQGTGRLSSCQEGPPSQGPQGDDD